MKLKTRNLFLASMVGLTVSSNGAISFTENFSSNTAGSNMTLGLNPQGATTTFAGGNFHIDSGVNKRIYLGSNDSNYNTVDFTFEADVTYSQNSSSHIAFLGMGTSNPNTAQFGEPNAGSVIAMTLRTDDTGGLGNVTGRDNWLSVRFARVLGW